MTELARVEDQSAPPWWRILLVGRNPQRTLVRIAVLVVTSFLVFKFVLVPIRVEGISMLPTYHEGQVNFINRFAYSFREPQRGDVVAIRTRAGEHVMYLKRIVALPGETIAFHRGRLVVNGQVITEPYLATRCYWEQAPETLKPGQFYFVGDNRSMPMVDHTQGRAERWQIVGKAIL